MKNISYWTLLLLLTLFIAACGKEEDEDDGFVEEPLSSESFFPNKVNTWWDYEIRITDDAGTYTEEEQRVFIDEDSLINGYNYRVLFLNDGSGERSFYRQEGESYYQAIYATINGEETPYDQLYLRTDVPEGETWSETIDDGNGFFQYTYKLVGKELDKFVNVEQFSDVYEMSQKIYYTPSGETVGSLVSDSNIFYAKGKGMIQLNSTYYFSPTDFIETELILLNYNIEP